MSMQGRADPRPGDGGAARLAETPPAGWAPLSVAQALTLCGAVLALYGRSFGYPLVFDDTTALNPESLASLRDRISIFGFRSLPFASFGWTYAVFGSEISWHRLGNVLLHCATAIVLMLFLRRLIGAAAGASGDPDAAHTAIWHAFFAALLFAVHPVAVYGVAYLVQRTILMATLFSLCALALYLEGILRGRAALMAWSIVFYALATLSKEHAVMLPGAALAMTILLRRPPGLSARRLRWVVGGFLGVATFAILKAKGVLGNAYEPMVAQIMAQMAESQSAVAAGAEAPIAAPYLLSIQTQGWLFFKYLSLWVIPDPSNMSVDLRQPLAATMLAWPQIAGLLAFLVYPVVAARLLMLGGVAGLLGFGLLYPWILFLVELSTVRLQEPFVLYRSYLWMCGMMATLPAILHLVPGRLKLAIPVAACLVCVPLTLNRIDSFSSPLKLWDDVVRKNTGESGPFAERGYVNRAVFHHLAGNDAQALADLTAAAALNPRSAVIFSNRCAILRETSRLDEALADCNHAIGLDTTHARAFLHRANVYITMGAPEKAVSDLDRALRLAPSDADLHLARAIAYRQTGRFQEADDDFAAVLSLKPRLALAWFLRAGAAVAGGRPDAALKYLLESCALGVGCTELQQLRGQLGR